MDHAALKTIVVKRRDCRELSILKKLNHDQIVKLHFFSFSRHDVESDDPDSDAFHEELCLNMFFEYLHLSLFDELQNNPQGLAESVCINYFQQLLVGLQYLHEQVGIFHRDIKPSNLLLNESRSILKICDFGSAKEIGSQEKHISYVCSRFYRAPELLLGSEEYDEKVDIWSSGCVLAEMVAVQVLFKGEDNMDQLVELICILGTLEPENLAQMKVPIKMLDQSVLASRLSGTILDRLVSKMSENETLATLPSDELLHLICDILQYIPHKRPSAADLLYNLSTNSD
eukprot:maker-scaffold972_size74859-snap-gene-0.8 protein:Tk01034 transcript:maker-scaffold972_size74859-snap-gene-0.8-mRNA-1 annotation:"pkinase-domain-containing protein"